MAPDSDLECPRGEVFPLALPCELLVRTHPGYLALSLYIASLLPGVPCRSVYDGSRALHLTLTWGLGFFLGTFSFSLALPGELLV